MLWKALSKNVPSSFDVFVVRAEARSFGLRRYWSGPARLLDGRLHATRWKQEIAQSVARRGEELKTPPPGLAAVVIGDRADSLLYVRRKGEACEAAGMRFFYEQLPGDVDQETVMRVLRRLNDDEAVHGVLLQLPVPAHLSESRLLEGINPRKDVDGLHPNNVGRLAMRGVWRPAFMPCAPLGVMELLRRENVSVRDVNAAVVGDSNVVGMPMSWLLRDAGASSVSVVHSRGVDFLKKYEKMSPLEKRTKKNIEKRDAVLISARRADVVIAAVGCPEIVRRDWVKPGAVVVDIGINAVPPLRAVLEESHALSAKDDDKKLEKMHSNVYSLPGHETFRVVGDVAADEVSHVASALSSVPGGAGPMTIAALLSNTFLGASRRDRSTV